MRDLLFKSSRGQAVFETALFMPLFLLGFFGVLFAVSYSQLAERVQLGVRYGGTVANLQNPYKSYSLWSMYDALDGGAPVDVAHCDGATPDPGELTVGRAALWQPKAGSTPVASCVGALGSLTLPNGQVLVESAQMKLTASTALSGFLSSNVFGGATVTQTSATANFLRSPDVGTLLGCSIVGNAVKRSLEAESDGVTPVTPPTAFPQVLPTQYALVPQACVTFAPDNVLAQETPPIVSQPSPPPSPCPPGYTGIAPNCVPPATPSPPPTIKPTPTPVPTACPKGYTGTAGACVPPPTPAPPPTAPPPPTLPPTPAPPATPVPPPTPTPAPTAMPTPNGGHNKS